MKIEVPELSGGLEIGFVNDVGGKTRVFVSLGRIEELTDPGTYAIVHEESPEKTAALLGPAFFRLFALEINAAPAGVENLIEVLEDNEFEVLGRFLRGEESLEGEEPEIRIASYLEASYSNIFASKTTPLSMGMLVQDTGLAEDIVRGHLQAHPERFRVEVKGDHEFVWDRKLPAETGDGN
ncbi:MAG TPA: hypothetical protein VK786_03755 [bacterium]|jgi:hypothetical protein|nr:hypothetical protein [bacterium]